MTKRIWSVDTVVDTLPEKLLNRFAQRHRSVDRRVRSRHIGANLDEVSRFCMSGHQPTEFSCKLLLFRVGHSVGDTAHRGKCVDRRIVPSVGQRPRQHHVSIENGSHGVSNGLVVIVAVNQDGVNPRD